MEYIGELIKDTISQKPLPEIHMKNWKNIDYSALNSMKIGNIGKRHKNTCDKYARVLSADIRWHTVLFKIYG